MTRPLPHNNARPNTITSMITRDLGYCCEWYFFSRYHDTELIAARLGVTARAVRKHKAAELKCQDCINCLKRRPA